MNSARSNCITEEDFQYAVEARRHLHRHPETGFALEHTVAYVCAKLDELGIPWTTRYGPGSVAAYIQPDCRRLTVGLRADMDALPIQEKTCLPYASEVEGLMHACGHDAHTGILLAAARVLKRNERTLPCRVKLLFQPSEEGEKSGALLMAENGALDDVDMVLCTHCDNAYPTGTLGIRAGDYMAACVPVTITFYGRTAHAAMAYEGADAIAMAVQAYGELLTMARDTAGDRFPYVFSVGCLEGGHAHNVVADCCRMKISFRYYDDAFAERVRRQTEEICTRAANAHGDGGRFELDWRVSAPALHNDETVTRAFLESVKPLFPESIVELPMRRSTEDFSWFAKRRPGMLFRFGTGNAQKGCVSLMHCNDFRLDEEGMRVPLQAFVQFIFDSDRISLADGALQAAARS